MFSRFLALFRKPSTSGEVGAHWERVAAKFLKREGMRIVTRNWHGRRGEIDIIARNGDCLVFVEVRARAQSALVGGYASITRHKRTVVREACMEYLRGLRVQPRTYRFDVVEVSFASRRDYDLLHHRNVRLFG